MVYRSNPWYIESPTHGILIPLPLGALTSLSMVYRNHYPWYIEPPSRLYWTPYARYVAPLQWYIDPITHGISNPLSMVFLSPYPCYIGTPAHGIFDSRLLYAQRFYKYIIDVSARWAMQKLLFIYNSRGRRCRDRRAVGLMTTYWINVYQHLDCVFDPRSGEVHSIQHDVIKLLSDLWYVRGFLRVLRFPPSTQLWNVVESDVKHNNPTKPLV